MSDVIGTKVAIPGASGAGIVRYIGPIQGKNGTFAGVELLGTLATTRGKNSGSVDGINYFQVDIPKSGLFLPYDRLKSVNPGLPNNRLSTRLPLTPINNRTYQNARVSMINENVAKSEDVPLKYEAEIAELQRSLREKEKRLENFAIQREEWRAAMDELVAVQQEGMQTFEDRIQELEQENLAQQEQLKQSGDSLRAANSKVKELELNIEGFLSEKVNGVEIDDHRKELDRLQRELEARPQLKDLDELQNALDELETIYQQRLDEKEACIKDLQTENARLQDENAKLQEANRKLQEENGQLQAANTHLESEKDSIHRDFQVTTPPQAQPVVDEVPNELPIYEAANPIDPSDGKNDWCGLCERDGHSSINCPYENDIF
ncbi:Nuclear fusion protein BIK1 [Candida viswanathii]|uniref:Nuclear fusion protein BIK1 n=1 Tax=Candida viswanathii TaxID=5486 RepID=A0A367XYW0_9ASCO|nr:Nuclear fusion protein BIK1 [Candida viswanathii]